MDKNVINHDWVENNHEYDGVLVCTNTLGQWNEDAILRAFQTFLWNHATMPGNDLTYVHVNTGVIVRYDGNILVIERGQGQLEDALVDLFDVLYSLGWRKAELYHPPESIADILAAMGRAIPARLDFDIQAAQSKQAVSDFPESRAMLALAAGGMDATNAILLGEMQAMDTNAVPGASMSPSFSQTKRTIILIDDDEIPPSDVLEDDQMSVLQVSNAKPVQVNSDTAQAFQTDSLDEEPQVFVIPKNKDDPFEDDRQKNAQVIHSIAQVDTSAPSDTPVAEVAVAQTVHAQSVDLMVTHQQEMVPESTRMEITLKKCINVGVSVFCFNFPSAPVSSDDVTAITDECFIEEWDVVHIRPGAMGQSVRWDVLGEVSSDDPWFAEKLVGAMFSDQGDSALLACIIMAMKANDLAQLRDLLAVENIPQNELASMLAAISPAAEALFVRSGTRGSRAPTMDEVVRRLGALALVPGGAFVDIRPSPIDIDEGEISEVFTVRSILQSQMARLFVIHVDQLDGPFVLWIVGLLQFVAANYATTARYSSGEVAIADADAMAHKLADEAELERQLQKDAAIIELTDRLKTIVAELSKHGVNV